MQLKQLGWDEWFDEQTSGKNLAELRVARVVAVDRDQLLVIDESGEFRAKLSGRFVYTTGQPIDFPCVGDWVCVHHNSADLFGIIHHIMPRKTFLRRKAAGGSVEYQMIASNVDAALIVQSCQYDFNIKRLERYLVMVTSGHVQAIVLLTKTDLITPETLRQILEKINLARIDAPVFALSNSTGEGVSRVREILEPGKTYCLLGSSGVGKSTLINLLTDDRILETGMVSATGEGRHITVRRELIMLNNGAMIIDNPGMREFGILGAADGMDNSFADIHELASQCKYGDCSHSTEPGCAVLAALETGALHQPHYANFLKLRSESKFYDMSYCEKRKKDKAFGRYKKNAGKELGILRKRK